jgi:hypothetical protein
MLLTLFDRKKQTFFFVVAIVIVNENFILWQFWGLNSGPQTC